MYWMISNGYRPKANFAPDSASTDKNAGEMKRACRGLKEPSPIRLTDAPALVRTIPSLFGARVDLRPSHIHNPNCAPLGAPACMSDQCFSIGQIPPLACCCHNLKYNASTRMHSEVHSGRGLCHQECELQIHYTSFCPSNQRATGPVSGLSTNVNKGKIHRMIPQERIPWGSISG